MSEISFINWRGTRFTRDTEIDYKKENIVIATIFGKYDQNRNGNLRDAGEFEAYEKAIQRAEKREVNKVTVHYDKKLEKLYKKYENLVKVFDTKESKELEEIFDKLLKFEDENNLDRCGYFEKSEKPEGEKSWDVSAFCMGDPSVLDKNGNVKIYEKGYILGFDKLDDSKQKEYLELFNRYSKLAKKFAKCYKEYEKLDNEHERYLGLKDMASTGLINPKRVGSKQYEDQAYQTYISVKSQNPFERQIKELEQKRLALYAKKENATQEDYQQIEQYNIQIQQLRNASSQWSIADTEYAEKIKTNGFNVNSINEGVTYTESNPSEESKTSNKMITDTHSVSMGYSNENINIIANIDNTQTYTIDPESEFKNGFNSYISADYAKGDSKIGASASIQLSDNFSMYTPSINFGYNNWGVNLTNTLQSSKMKSHNEKGELVEQKSTSNSTNITLFNSIGIFNNNASVEVAEEEKKYSLSSYACVDQQLGKYWSYNLNPIATISYSQKAESCTLSPSINAGISYNNHKDFKAKIEIKENYSSTITNSKNTISNTFTSSIEASYKKVRTTASYTNGSDGNTFGGSIELKTKKAGIFTLNGSIQKGYNKELKKDTYSNSVTLTYSAPLDWTQMKKDKKN